jgi:predicted DNA-binding transcriptional regulator AlpA
MIRAKQMPKGRKVTGHNELRWYRDEIDDCIKKIEEGKITLQK